MGTSQMFGPTPGKMLTNLKAAGIDPKDIDAVVATHAHCDHVWGSTSSPGPSTKREHSIWTFCAER
jgi:metal-dependent hydrolase (beta-lactamase superfamily II)